MLASFAIQLIERSFQILPFISLRDALVSFSARESKAEAAADLSLEAIIAFATLKKRELLKMNKLLIVTSHRSLNGELK
jgi:hypothetical protein